MKRQDIDLIAIEDTEGRRNPGLRYLTGMPEDALVFLTREGKSILVPWDDILAREMAFADEIIPYNSYKRRFKPALDDIIKREGFQNPAVEIAAATPHPVFLDLSEGFTGSLVCRADGFDKEIDRLKCVKSSDEIALIREACRLTNIIIDELEQELAKGTLQSELDVAFYIERRAKTMGATGLAFETIAAGPDRSWGIHAYPGFTADAFAASGFALVDFGIRYEGFVTDVTLPCVFGEPATDAKAMLDAVDRAYKLCMDLIRPGANGFDISKSIDEFFSSKGFAMPHALGHGIGTEAHENPVFRSREDSAFTVEPGMVLAVEPGLYDKNLGGVRLENDLLVTGDGIEILTKSRFLFFPHR